MIAINPSYNIYTSAVSPDLNVNTPNHVYDVDTAELQVYYQANPLLAVNTPEQRDVSSVLVVTISYDQTGEGASEPVTNDRPWAVGSVYKNMPAALWHYVKDEDGKSADP